MILGRNPNPGRVLMDIAEDAEIDSIIVGDRIHHAKRTGNWPESLKPGRFLMRLPDEVRSVLKKLRSDDLKKARYPLH
jgi:hypothetical protein